jgi:hypothetical protein
VFTRSLPLTLTGLVNLVGPNSYPTINIMHRLQLQPNTLAVLVLTLLAGFRFVAASPLSVEPVRKDEAEVRIVHILNI